MFVEILVKKRIEPRSAMIRHSVISSSIADIEEVRHSPWGVSGRAYAFDCCVPEANRVSIRQGFVYVEGLIERDSIFWCP